LKGALLLCEYLSYVKGAFPRMRGHYACLPSFGSLIPGRYLSLEKKPHTGSFADPGCPESTNLEIYKKNKTKGVPKSDASQGVT
jgi:hypothetical protein